MEPQLIIETAHRPWSLPTGPWIMAMRWHDLLFLHWPVRPEVLRPMIPRALELDTFDGLAWLGVVPFRMTGVRPRCLPAFGGMAFPEINVRTYVKTPGRSGVWFFSLDATSRLAVRAARVLYGLPYYDARIRVETEQETVHYRNLRTDRKTTPVEFEASYKPTGSVYHAGPGTLDHWLTERYCLYSVTRGKAGFLDIHHLPWPLQPSEAELRVNSMTLPLGIALPETPPLAHFARRLDVIAWQLRPLTSGAP